jgi:hypothetical protein
MGYSFCIASGKCKVAMVIRLVVLIADAILVLDYGVY